MLCCVYTHGRRDVTYSEFLLICRKYFSKYVHMWCINWIFIITCIMIILVLGNCDGLKGFMDKRELG